MKRRLLPKTAYILLLSLLISSVAFTSSGTDVYDEYYKGLFSMINMFYNRDLGEDNISGMALNGAMENLNEYSCFVLNDDSEAPAGVTGVYLESVRSGLKVVSVLPASSASAAGIKAGDTIVRMDKMNTSTMSESRFNSYIISNGKALVEFIDRDTGYTESAVLEPDVNSGRDTDFVYLDDVGYIRVNRFSEAATERVKGILESMDAMGNHDLIIDLRSLVTMDIEDACAMADLLVPGGTMARTKERTYNAERKDVDFNVALLIDGSTTGAAEVAADAIPGTVYGTESAGYAVYIGKYPVFSQYAYDYYVEKTGYTEIGSIINYLKGTGTEISESSTVGQLNIVESGVYNTRRKRIDATNTVMPDVRIENTEMGYLGFTPGSYMIDVVRDYREGNINYDVFIAKNILGVLGYFDGDFTAVFGSDMTKAVNEYKEDMGWEPDGILDMDTQASLNTYSMKTAVMDDECVKKALEDFKSQ